MATATRTSRTARKTGTPSVRLLLGIDDQLYRVCPLGPGAFRLTKLGPEGLVYDVALTPDGIRCDCPDFAFRRDGITPDPCKHGAALVQSGLLS